VPPPPPAIAAEPSRPSAVPDPHARPLPDDAGAVSVAAEQCAPAFMEQLNALLRVELSARAVGPASAADAFSSGVRVALRCMDTQLAIDAQHDAGPARSESVSLAATPLPLRPRVAALRVAEIVRALDQAVVHAAQLSLAVAPAPPPVREPQPPAARSAPPAQPRSFFTAPLQLAVLVQASAFHGDDAWLVGPSMAADYQLGAFVLGAGAGFAQRREPSVLGETITYTGQLAPHAAWSLTSGRWQARLGAGCALGFTRVAARAQAPGAGARDLSAPWLAPHALATLAFAFTPATRLQLRAAAGWVALPLVAEVDRSADIAQRGLWTQLQLGAALAL
jgi:hypothetical protein